MAIDKINPATWERTGETMPDGAPVLLNPGNGLPCVMPRPSWPNPHTPRSIQVYRNEARDQLDKAAPDMLAALKEAQRMVGAYVLALERGGNETDAAHARYVERQIAGAIAKAEGAA